MIKIVFYVVFLCFAAPAGWTEAFGGQSTAAQSVESVSENPQDRLYLEALRGNDVKRLVPQIDNVSDVDLAPLDGRTALMFLAKRNRPKMVEKLLSRGADANATNANGGTPLMYAAIAGNIDIVKALVKAGGDVDARGSNGWSAIMVAAAKGHADLVRYLISIDVETDAVDVYNWTPLIRASYENRLAVVAVLIESGQVAINHRDDQGATALHHAAGNGYDELVERLMQAGANPALTDNNELTPLDRAIAAQHKDVQKLFCDRLSSLSESEDGMNSEASRTTCANI